MLRGFRLSCQSPFMPARCCRSAVLHQVVEALRRCPSPRTSWQSQWVTWRSAALGRCRACGASPASSMLLPTSSKTLTATCRQVAGLTNDAALNAGGIVSRVPDSSLLACHSLSPCLSGAAIELAGDYVWGEYNLLVLPPSFPYGGASARLTAVTLRDVIPSHHAFALCTHPDCL